MSLPSQQELLALLSYCPITGMLHWRRRPVTAFSSLRVANWWNSRYAFKEAFTATDKKGYRVGAIDDVNYRASRVIYKMVHGVDPDQVDHEDGNTLNNRIHNLRDVSGSVNQKNMKTPSNNTSGHIGVCWDKKRNKWEAKIKSNGKTIHLGRFTDMADAIAARKAAEVTHNFHPNHGR